MFIKCAVLSCSLNAAITNLRPTPECKTVCTPGYSNLVHVVWVLFCGCYSKYVAAKGACAIEYKINDSAKTTVLKRITARNSTTLFASFILIFFVNRFSIAKYLKNAKKYRQRSLYLWKVHKMGTKTFLYLQGTLLPRTGAQYAKVPYQS